MMYEEILHEVKEDSKQIQSVYKDIGTKLTPPKLSSSAVFMINLCPKHYSFPCPTTCSTPRLRNIKEKGGMKRNRTLRGSQVPILSKNVLCFLFVGNGLHSAFMTFPESQRTDSNSFSSVKGGDAETREKQSRNNGAVLG